METLVENELNCVTLKEIVSPGNIFVAVNLVALPETKVIVKKLPVLQSILAVWDEIVNAFTTPLTLPLNTWLPINELLPVVAYEPVFDCKDAYDSTAEEVVNNS